MASSFSGNEDRMIIEIIDSSEEEENKRKLESEEKRELHIVKVMNYDDDENDDKEEKEIIVKNGEIQPDWTRVGVYKDTGEPVYACLSGNQGVVFVRARGEHNSTIHLSHHYRA